MKLQKMRRLFIPVLALGMVAMLSTANVLAAELTLVEGATIEEEQGVGELEYNSTETEEHELSSEVERYVEIEPSETEITMLSELALPDGAVSIRPNLDLPDFMVIPINGWHESFGLGIGFPSSILVLDEGGNILEIIPVVSDMVSGFDNSTAGVQEVTITFLGLEYSFTIEVVEIIYVIPNLTMTTNGVFAEVSGHIRANMRIYDANNPSRLLQVGYSPVRWSGWSSGPGHDFTFSPTNPFCFDTMTISPGVWEVTAENVRTNHIATFTITVLGEESPDQKENENDDSNNHQNNNNGSTNNNQEINQEPNQITNQDTNRSTAPQTGDSNNMATYGLMALLSLLMIYVLMHMKQKKNK